MRNMKTSTEIMVENSLLTGAYYLLKGAELDRIEVKIKDGYVDGYYLYFKNADFEKLKEEKDSPSSPGISFFHLESKYYSLLAETRAADCDYYSKKYAGGQV